MKKRILEQYGTIWEDEGHISIKWNNPQAGAQRLEFFKENLERDIEVRYEVVHDLKTRKQLAFFHGVVVPALCKATGDPDRERIKYFLKDMYLKKVIEVLGEPVTIIPSLSELSKPDMSHFIENCLQLLADSGGSIDEQVMDEYETMMRGAK